MASVRNRTRFVKSGGRGDFKDDRRKNPKSVTSGTLLSTEGTSLEERGERTRLGNLIDEEFGFPRFESGPKKVGWLVNMHSTVLEEENGGEKAGVDYYFLDGVGGSFKATVMYDPYFLIACKPGTEGEVEEWVRRKFEGLIKKTSRVKKEDLSMVGLSGGVAGLSMLIYCSQTISSVTDEHSYSSTLLILMTYSRSGRA
jgi:DNA polymerase epsilon subunit 1